MKKNIRTLATIAMLYSNDDEKVVFVATAILFMLIADSAFNAMNVLIKHHEFNSYNAEKTKEYLDGKILDCLNNAASKNSIIEKIVDGVQILAVGNPVASIALSVSVISEAIERSLSISYFNEIVNGYKDCKTIISDS